MYVGHEDRRQRSMLGKNRMNGQSNMVEVFITTQRYCRIMSHKIRWVAYQPFSRRLKAFSSLFSAAPQAADGQTAAPPH